jgi:hypothetical protein
MGRNRRFTIILLVVAIIYLGFYFGGAVDVPFHPDEATQIYMSGDFKEIFNNPSTLAYAESPASSIRQHYRLVDAPLTRYLIGAGLWITGHEPIQTDWDWSLPWEPNISAGAMPSPTVLLITRIACSLLIPVGLAVFYLTLRKFSNPWVSLAGVCILAVNSLILLHTRRAMAESILLSLFLLILWRLTWPYSLRNLIWISILSGLLVQTKQLSLPLVAASILAVAWQGFRKSGWKTLPASLFLPVFAIVLFWFALNPVMWKNPIQVAPVMVRERQALSQEQVFIFSSMNSGLAFQSPLARFTGILAQTFFAHPAYFDVGNYTNQLQPSIIRYEQNPFNLLLSGGIWGGLFLILVVLSLIFWITDWIKRKTPPPPIVITSIWLGFIHVIAFISFGMIGFQRYYLLFIPLALLPCIHRIQKITDQIQALKSSN